jgi:hypothetical protein
LSPDVQAARRTRWMPDPAPRRHLLIPIVAGAGWKSE